MEANVVAIERMYPPGNSADLLALPNVPVLIDGDVLSEPQKLAYDTLMRPVEAIAPAEFNFSPNPSYERYLRIHKVFVGKQGADKLEAIHQSLYQESTPRYLAAAASAAVECALVQNDKPTNERLELLKNATDCWERALGYQQQWNEVGESHMLDYAFPYRVALDLAVMPLLEDVVRGNVRPATSKRVFEDCLNIAQANAVRINLMKRAGNIQGLGEHSGLGYECNALLAFNKKLSPTWFVIPSMVRSDTGYHHRQQTHDLLVIHQKWGEVLSATPVEIKSTAGRRERQRYQALLVRGKLHLSVSSKHRPEEILESITACYNGDPSKGDLESGDGISERLTSMVRDYYAGQKLGTLATGRSLTNFRDNSLVAARHPGLCVA